MTRSRPAPARSELAPLTLGLSLVALLAAAGCGGGSSSATDLYCDTNQWSENPICGDLIGQQVGEYVTDYNAWNVGGFNRYCHRNEIAAGADEGVDVGWRWSMTGQQEWWSAYAYPEVIFGKKPDYYTCSTTAALPRHLPDLAGAQVDFAYSSTHSGNGNLAFDLWLSPSEGGATIPKSHEVMIWLDHWGDAEADGDVLAVPTIGGRQWDLHVVPGFTADGGAHHWVFVAYVARSPVQSPVSLDLKEFLDDLTARNVATGQEWLAAVELGNELGVGAGSTEVTGYRVRVE